MLPLSSSFSVLTPPPPLHKFNLESTALSFKSTPAGDRFDLRRTAENRYLVNAIERKRRDDSGDSETVISRPPIPVEETQSEEVGDGAETSKPVSEISKALKGRGGSSGGWWGGVAEEIGKIEWPAFGKVLGTTGVVLGVIAGSSVVLLTVNALLAELSDRVFGSKGVQDFFG